MQAFIKPEYLTEARAILESQGYVEDPNPPTGTQKGFTITNHNFETLKDIRFRITYTPLYKLDLYTYRERIMDDEIPSYQYYNQQSNVIDSDVLAQLHDKVIQRGTGASKTLVLLHKNKDSIIEPGSRYGNYMFTSADYVYNKHGVKITYNLDEYWAKLQKFVAVLEEYRQSSIPTENIVTRQITGEIFANFDDEAIGAEEDTFWEHSDYIGDPDNVEVNLFNIGSPYGIALSAARFPFNNSFVFEAEFEGNASVGKESVDFDGIKRNNREISYTDINGRWVGPQWVSFGRNFAVMDLERSHALPRYTSALSKYTLFRTINFDKDSRERLKFVFQTHHIDRTGKVYINKGFPMQNGLIGGNGLQHEELRYALLKIIPYEDEAILGSDIINMMPVNITMVGTSVELPTITNVSVIEAKATALIKDNGFGQYEILY